MHGCKNRLISSEIGRFKLDRKDYFKKEILVHELANLSLFGREARNGARRQLELANGALARVKWRPLACLAHDSRGMVRS